MSHRQRDTHIVTVYGKVETGETDTLGDPITDQQVVLRAPAAVFDPPRGSAGDLEARDAGETVIETKDVVLSTPDAATISPGAELAIHRRGDDPAPEDPVYTVVRRIEDSKLRGGRGPWRLTVDRAAGDERGDL